jgi:hypothetical protein
MKSSQNKTLAGSMAGAFTAGLFALGLWYISVHEGYGPDYEPVGMPILVGGAAVLGAMSGAFGSFFKHAKPGAIVGSIAVLAGWIGMGYAMNLNPLTEFELYDWVGAGLSLVAGAVAGAAGSWVGGPKPKKSPKPKTA